MFVLCLSLRRRRYCRYLGEQLMSNHALLSVHVYGNANNRSWVDTRGFLRVFDKGEQAGAYSGIRSRRMEAPRKKRKEELDWVSAAPVRERPLTVRSRIVLRLCRVSCIHSIIHACAQDLLSCRKMVDEE